jgi:transcriptional regulator with XRE-family HTH domain
MKLHRILELRTRRGLTHKQLADAAGVSESTISRLEGGHVRLMVDQLQRLARALGVTAADLILDVILADVVADVEPLPSEDAPVVTALATAGVRLYTVISDSVIDAGIAPGNIVPVRTGAAAIGDLKTGDIALLLVTTVQTGTDALVLRQFVAPALFTTNKPHGNVGLRMDTPDVKIEILGVVARN